MIVTDELFSYALYYCFIAGVTIYTNSIQKYHFSAIRYNSFTTILFRLQYLLKINRCFMQILMEIVFWFLSFYAVTLILQNGVAIQENMKHIWWSSMEDWFLIWTSLFIMIPRLSTWIWYTSILRYFYLPWN